MDPEALRKWVAEELSIISQCASLCEGAAQLAWPDLQISYPHPGNVLPGSQVLARQDGVKNYESENEGRKAKYEETGYTDVKLKDGQLAEFSPMLLHIFHQVFYAE